MEELHMILIVFHKLSHTFYNGNTSRIGVNTSQAQGRVLRLLPEGWGASKDS